MVYNFGSTCVKSTKRSSEILNVFGNDRLVRTKCRDPVHGVKQLTVCTIRAKSVEFNSRNGIDTGFIGAILAVTSDILSSCLQSPLLHCPCTMAPLPTCDVSDYAYSTPFWFTLFGSRLRVTFVFSSAFSSFKLFVWRIIFKINHIVFSPLKEVEHDSMLVRQKHFLVSGYCHFDCSKASKDPDQLHDPIWPLQRLINRQIFLEYFLRDQLQAEVFLISCSLVQNFEINTIFSSHWAKSPSQEIYSAPAGQIIVVTAACIVEIFLSYWKTFWGMHVSHDVFGMRTLREPHLRTNRKNSCPP